MQMANIFTFDARPLLNEFTTTSQYTEGESGKTARNRHLLNNFIDKVHPEDLPAAMAAVEEHRNSNTPSFKVVTRLRMKGKQYRWYESSGRIMRLTDSGEIERVVGLSIDITEEKELNQQLIASREEAIAANKAKSAFLTRISHEFRTPLNAIIGFTDVLNNTVSDPVQKEYLLSIKKSGQNLLRLITDILDYSKIEAGKIELQLRPVNLVHLICETETMFIPNVKEKGLVFNVVVDEPMPKLLLLDDLQVRQILINLQVVEQQQLGHGLVHHHIKHQTLFLNIGYEHGLGLTDQVHQIDRTKLQRYFTGLNFGVIQNVGYQAQQILTALFNA